MNPGGSSIEKPQVNLGYETTIRARDFATNML